MTRALMDLNKSLEIYHNRVGTSTIRGSVYLDLEEYGSSLTDFNRALAIDERTLQIQEKFYFNREEYHNALTDLNKSLEIEPTNAHTLRISQFYKMLKYGIRSNADI